jgi:hypothetical protein
VGCCRIGGGRKDAWKTSGEECCGERPAQDEGPGPMGGCLPIRLDVTHQHMTTHHVVETRTNKGMSE